MADLDYLSIDFVFIGLVAILFVVVLRGIGSSSRKKKPPARKSKDTTANNAGTGTGAVGGSGFDGSETGGDGSGDGGGD